MGSLFHARLTGRTVWEAKRGLPEEIAQARGGAHEDIAEPQPPVEANSLTCAFDTKPCRYDRGSAVNAHCLRPRILILDLVRDDLVPRLPELLFARVYPPVAENQYHIFVQDSRHGRRIVSFHCRLEFAIEIGHLGAIAFRGRRKWRSRKSGDRHSSYTGPPHRCTSIRGHTPSATTHGPSMYQRTTAID